MKQFDYTIATPRGIHAHPAALLTAEAKQFNALCTITKGGRTANLTQIMALVNLGIKQGDTVTVRAQGADSDAAITALQTLFRSTL